MCGQQLLHRGPKSFHPNSNNCLPSSVVMAKILKEHGVTPSLAIGYSLGEWTALWSSGMIAEEDLCRCVAARGRAMESTGAIRGGMATVASPPKVVEEIVRSVAGYV